MPVRPEAPATIAAPLRGWRIWWAAARPRTLTLAATPVLVGTALAWAEGAPKSWVPALAAFVGALLIQAGTNLHNDAADFVRGNDRPDRVGPLRVTAAGLATPALVRAAAFATFAAAFLLGIYLVAVGGWPIVAIGLASLAAGWAYSGGPRPISYTPFGELFVWLFFGLAAVAGSYLLQADHVSATALLAGAAVGLPAAAVLTVNNHRDRADDLRAGRRTLAGLLGPQGACRAYGVMMLLPFLAPPAFAALGQSGALLALLALPLHWHLIRRLRTATDAALNPMLAATARAGLVFGTLLAVGLSI